MHPNPVLKKLGFSKQDRVVIINVSEIGMSHASVIAFEKLWEFGLISAGSAMVPCPWFYEAAAFCRENRGIDVGVHLTLTSEWQTYRWGPISTRDVGSGMIDFEGCFYGSFEEALDHGDPEAIQLELRAQVERAHFLGVEPTHVDVHLGSLEHPKYMPGYLQLAAQYALPPLLLRRDENDWQRFGLEPETAKLAALMIAQTEEMSVPLLDHFKHLVLPHVVTLEGHISIAKQSLDELKPGITHFEIHPAIDTPEIRAMTPDWASRIAIFQVFTSEELSEYVQKSGIQLIGYRTLKELMPSLS